MKTLLLTGLVVLVIAVNVPAQADHLFSIEQFGSFVSQGTPIDTDGDGRTADLVITHGKGEWFAQTSAQSVIEWGSFGQKDSCNPGEVGSTLVSGSSVIRTVKGLLFVTFDEGTNCFDADRKKAAVVLEGEVAGGTGSYEGAAGTINITGTVYPVLFTGSDAKFGGVDLRGEVTWNGHKKGHK
jgi:hypothetical protein